MTTPLPDILFEDQHVIVLSKPAGLLSQGEHTGAPTLVGWLRDHLGRNYVGLIHRLDRNTSGIMAAAKRSKAAKRMTEALRSGEMHRTYLACLEGIMPGPVTWRHHLLKDGPSNLVKAVRAGTAGALEATLSVRPLATGLLSGRKITLAEFVLGTGRSHQIRVQSAAAGHPVVGDPKYGRGGPPGRPALHSHRIRFPHPMSGDILEFEAPVPDDMSAVMPSRAKRGHGLA